MTRVRYIGYETPVTSSHPRVLLTNNKGDFLSLGKASNYDGFYVKTENGYVKIFADVLPAETVKEITVGTKSVTRSFRKSTQKIAVDAQGVLMQCKGAFTLTLDCKRLHDESEQGRTYTITETSVHGVSILHVTYVKENAYEVHLSIATTLQHSRKDTWRTFEYPYDQRRGTHSTPWVYDALELTGKGHIAIAAGQDSDRKALDLLQRTETVFASNELAPRHFSSSALLAWRALSALHTDEGIMAGLPWFFHHWSRDELIAVGGLLAAKEYDAVIAIIDKWYRAVRSDGTLPAIYPDEGLESVDAPGWLGKRTAELLAAYKKSGQHLDQAMLKRWYEASHKLLASMQARLREDLVWSDADTTWMDTSSNDDGRAGARIEIQALFLSLCDGCAALSAAVKQPCDTRPARAVTKAVHSRLVLDAVLLDGLHRDGTQDHTVRPNIFLAWYIAPRLFTKPQWRRFFKAALPRLWLPWGGLSSIATDSGRFHPYDTGEDVAAYHRGDSWYFVNNIAAMALYDVDSVGFSGEIQRIVRASMDDLLSLGYLGHASEISSAEKQEAMGCHAQAWSASTLLELLLRTGR